MHHMISNRDAGWIVACVFSFLLGVIAGIRSGRPKKK